METMGIYKEKRLAETIHVTVVRVKSISVVIIQINNASAAQ